MTKLKKAKNILLMLLMIITISTNTLTIFANELEHSLDYTLELSETDYNLQDTSNTIKIQLNELDPNARAGYYLVVAFNFISPYQCVLIIQNLSPYNITNLQLDVTFIHDTSNGSRQIFLSSLAPGQQTQATASNNSIKINALIVSLIGQTNSPEQPWIIGGGGMDNDKL